MISSTCDLSVLITFCNQRKYVASLLDTIFTQKTSYSDEVLVALDGDDDGTIDILNEYQKQHSNLYYYVVNDNKYELPLFRVSHNRIFLLNKSKGKYFCTIDGDDEYITDERFESGIHFLENHIEYIGHACSKRIYNMADQIYKDDIYPTGIVTKNNYKNKYIGSAQTIFRNIFTSEKYFDEKHFDDAVLFHFMLEKGDIFYENKVMFMYRVGGNNSIYQSQNQLYRQCIHIINSNAIGKFTFNIARKKRLLDDVISVLDMCKKHKLPNDIKKAANTYNIPYLINISKINDGNFFEKLSNYLYLYTKIMHYKFSIFVHEYASSNEKTSLL